ncbi:MAG: hypothetical protein IPP72_16040 [Chitinophagaceae bacterium]|nr:hypothetical protein [Chitinophagaceae bacterium]
MNNALIKLLEKEREQLILKLKVVEHAIVAYQHSSIINGDELFIDCPGEPNNNFLDIIQALVQKYQHYNPAEPTRNKILFIIKTESRFLHVREIARIVQQLENELSITAIIKKISPALSILKRLPGSPLVSVEVARSHFNTFWGYRDWLTEEGNIKDGFIYNESEITKLHRHNLFA